MTALLGAGGSGGLTEAEVTALIDATRDEITASVYLPAPTFSLATGGVATLGSTNDCPAWLLDAAANERIGTTVDLPADWVTFDASIVWTNQGAGAGNVVWQLAYKAGWGDGELVGVDVAAANVTVAAPLVEVAKVTPMAAGVAVPAGERTTFRVARIATDAGDTLANDAAFLGLLLTRAS